MSGGWFEKFTKSERTPEMKEAVQTYNLTDSDCLILQCFLGNMSQYFRDDCYRQFDAVPEVAKEMQTILEIIIKKSPVHNDGVDYRFLNTCDNSSLQEGDIMTVGHCLTTTTDDWEQDKDIYVITPLPKERTSAHDLYKIINHGGENQVDFLKGTKFLVRRLETDSKNGYKRIYLEEIKCLNSNYNNTCSASTHRRRPAASGKNLRT